MKNYVTSIIAGYNEERNIPHVLAALSKVTCISQIIFIDDGSTDNSYEIVKELCPFVTAIRLEKNMGKVAAVARGVVEAKEDTLLLIDSDLEHVIPEEIDTVIKAYFASAAAMVLFQVKTTHAKIDGLLNKYIVFTGTRLLKKEDLLKVLKTHPNGYQLEAAINKYFMDNKKIVRWASCSAINPNKIKKEGWLKGVTKNIEMELSILSYAGVLNHFQQICCFGREKL